METKKNSEPIPVARETATKGTFEIMASNNNSSGMHLQNLILDNSLTTSSEQKIECIKLLKVVVKNLADPLKCSDPKYRQLRLSNEKVERKLLPCPSAISYLESIGFQKENNEDGSRYLRVPSDTEVDVAQMESSMLELNNALKILGPSSYSSSSSSSNKKMRSFIEEKKTSEKSSSSGNAQLSEKQKARLLLEQKRLRENEEAKVARAKTKAMLKQDKYVRKHDKNWKSGVSSACMKSGEGISTFRDKYGEN